MDILKLLFEHDMLLEQQPGNTDPRNRRKRMSTLEELMHPIPTYSRFYISGTRFDDKDYEFGLDRLQHYPMILTALDRSFTNLKFTTSTGKKPTLFSSAFTSLNKGEAIVMHTNELLSDPSELTLGTQSGVYERLPQLIAYLDRDNHVVFKEPALNGFDIHIFTRHNLYDTLFHTLKDIRDDSLRFFSINGKRAKNEKLFYFETYRIDDPPHGFTEIHQQSVN